MPKKTAKKTAKKVSKKTKKSSKSLKPFEAVYALVMEYQRKGISEHETLYFTNIADARKEMKEQIENSDTLSEYREDIGTEFEDAWEITDRIEEFDFYEINGNDGDYFESFQINKVKPKKSHKITK